MGFFLGMTRCVISCTESKDAVTLPTFAGVTVIFLKGDTAKRFMVARD